MFILFILLCAVYLGPILAILAVGAVRRYARNRRAYRRHGIRSLVRAAKARAIARWEYQQSFRGAP